MSDITLSKAVRSNLLNLQSTATQMAKTQERLATGLKVNRALDNPTNFFTASALTARAGDLSNLLDSVSNAIQTVEAADNGIKGITKLVQTAQSIARQALQDRTASSVTKAESDTGVGGATTRSGAEGTTLASLGLADGDTISFTTTNASSGVSQSFSFTVAAGDKISDLVSAVNGSGVATASVSADGKISFATEGANGLDVEVAAADGDGDLTPTNVAEDVLNAMGFASAASITDHAVDGPGTDTAGVSITAAGAASSSSRADLAKQFNDMLDQIDQLAADSGFNGVNLLGGLTEKLKVAFNEDSSSSITIEGQDFSAEGLGLTRVTGDFSADAEIQGKIEGLSNALVTLRAKAASFGANLSVIETRQSFTKEMINTLETGAANLTLADTNEEAANMLALQTRQQLSSTALSLASQADQQVLQLF